jgi:hypothetical protein
VILTLSKASAGTKWNSLLAEPQKSSLKHLCSVDWSRTLQDSDDETEIAPWQSSASPFQDDHYGQDMGDGMQEEEDEGDEQEQRDLEGNEQENPPCLVDPEEQKNSPCLVERDPPPSDVDQADEDSLQRVDSSGNSLQSIINDYTSSSPTLGVGLMEVQQDQDEATADLDVAPEPSAEKYLEVQVTNGGQEDLDDAEKSLPVEFYGETLLFDPPAAEPEVGLHPVGVADPQALV